MRRALALGAALLAAAGAASAGEPEAACRPASASTTVFEVVVGSFPTVIDRTRNIDQVNRLRSSDMRHPPLAHGLSVAEYHLRDVVQSDAARTWPGGRTCAWLSRVTVDMTPDAIRVYIPKEYPPRSCEYEALVAHEMEHARLHRRRLKEAAERVRLALARATGLAGPHTPLAAETPQEAYALLQSQVEGVVLPIYDEFLKSIAAEQQALDDAEHYRRLGAACSHWKSI